MAELDRGVGLMGKFDFDMAREIFATLAKQHPDWYEATLDFAIATLNRQHDGDEALAREALQSLRVKRPDDLRVLYLQGLIALHGESPAAAEPLLRRVVEADANDSYAAYFLAQALLRQQRAADALALFDRAVALDPQLRSAHYGAAQALQRLGRTDEATRRLDEFSRQRNNPLARLAEFKYTRMGSKSEAIGATRPATARARPSGPLFAPPTSLTGPALPAKSNPVASAVDIDGDGRIDIYVPGGKSARSNVFLARDGGFEAQPSHPLAAIASVEFAAWGDIDNDGLVDVLLCRSGAPPLLMRQDPRGTWTSLATPALAKLGDARDCMLFDADHDGDLDIAVVTARGERVIVSNNGDRTFRSLGDRFPALPAGSRASQFVAADVDNDRDLDLVILHERGPHELLQNELLWKWQRAKGFDALANEPAIAAVAADLDANGEMDIVTLTPDLGVRRWKRGRDSRWTSTTLVPASNAPAPGVRAQLAVVDLDGDGRAEIIATSERGLTVWRLTDTGTERVFDLNDTTVVAWTVATLDDKGPTLITHHRNGKVLRHAPGTGRTPFALLTLRGRADPAQSIRSNASGIGARVAARIEGRNVLADTLRPSSGPGQSLTPLAIGVADAPRIDFVTIDWSDGVFQTETDVRVREPQTIVETQRQLSSCPLLFVWDGRRYAFISDLLGVGGLGYMVAPNQYAPPRPWENFLLPSGIPASQDNRFRLKIAEPMEETAYLDQVKLVAHDLPPGWDMVLDERMQIGVPDVTGQPRYFHRQVVPLRATNSRGDDVTELLRVADGNPADPGALDPRFIGRLARNHVLTLEFDVDLDRRVGAPVLIADGWIEYPYSQTMFAAWQAKADYRAPTIEAKGRDGRWQVVWREFGYPAGMPRTMSLPLRALPKGTRALRLSTNQQIYWDRIAVAWSEPADVVTHELALTSADVRATGFPRRSTREHQLPDYDYDRRKPLWDTRVQTGAYTAFGPADALIATHDDAFAVIGPGDELHVEFDANLPALPPGWTRRFVLETRGFAKDMDLYTRDGNTVGPLPSTGMNAGIRDRLHQRFNTRFAAGR
jgi:tetratricopeptide (TPR) repeat protein